MPPRTPRSTDPLRWRNLLLAGAAVSAVVTGIPQTSPANAAGTGQARLWLAAGEGGEGGEGGAPVDASVDAGYLIELGKVEAHVLAASLLYEAGSADDAAALAGHPEGEFMEDLRPKLAAHDVADFTSGLDGLVEVLADDAGLVPVADALGKIVDAIRTAQSGAKASRKDRLGAVTQLARDAAAEYEAAFEDGATGDPVALAEARGYLGAARALALLDAVPDATTDRILAAIDGTAEAFPIGAATDGFVADPTILYAAAARIEFAALAMK